MFIGR